MDNFYRHYRLIRMSRKATRFVESLFNEYLADPRQLPPTVQRNPATLPLERAVCDYIAGMTDRYALREYERLSIHMSVSEARILALPLPLVRDPHVSWPCSHCPDFT